MSAPGKEGYEQEAKLSLGVIDQLRHLGRWIDRPQGYDLVQDVADSIYSSVSVFPNEYVLPANFDLYLAPKLYRSEVVRPGAEEEKILSERINALVASMLGVELKTLGIVISPHWDESEGYFRLIESGSNDDQALPDYECRISIDGTGLWSTLDVRAGVALGLRGMPAELQPLEDHLPSDGPTFEADADLRIWRVNIPGAMGLMPVVDRPRAADLPPRYHVIEGRTLQIGEMILEFRLRPSV